VSKYSERLNNPAEEVEHLTDEELLAENVDDAIDLMKMLGIHPSQENVAYATKIPPVVNNSIRSTPPRILRGAHLNRKVMLSPKGDGK
jgi:hypothetical protein